MPSRSVETRRLVERLREELGLPGLEVAWHGPGGSYFGGWRLRWADGPLEPELAEEIRRRAGDYPALSAPEDFGYDRVRTAWGISVAVLLHLDRHPEQVLFARDDYWQVEEQAFAEVAWPERAAEPWPSRARAMIDLSPGGDDLRICDDGMALLGSRVRSAGWAGAMAWLDGVAEGAGRAPQPPLGHVIDLRTRKRIR